VESLGGSEKAAVALADWSGDSVGQPLGFKSFDDGQGQQTPDTLQQ
jgi:hypothetical protein